jgi:hypothetical protein
VSPGCAPKEPKKKLPFVAKKLGHYCIAMDSLNVYEVVLLPELHLVVDMVCPRYCSSASMHGGTLLGRGKYKAGMVLFYYF